MSDLQYVKVVPFLPLKRELTYSIRKERGLKVAAGYRALVPLGRRQVTGMVVKTLDKPDYDDLKEVTDVLDPGPVVTPEILELTRWMANYYLCSWGEALKCAIPRGINIQTRKKIRLLDQTPGQTRAWPGKQKQILAILARYKKAITLFSLQSKVGREDLFYHLGAMEKRGVIEVIEELQDATVHVKYEKQVTLKAEAITHGLLQQMEKRAPRQKAAIDVLIQLDQMSSAAQLYQQDITYATVKALAKKGLVSISQVETFRDPLAQLQPFPKKDITLTPEQEQVRKGISTALGSRTFGTFMIHGVTGSGKTEIYIRLVEEVLQAGREAIILVPEIALTPQMIRHFRAAFAEAVAIVHSKISLGERYDVWRQVLAGNYKVIIGPRSALFAPLKNLGLIIVDEEQETSYKQYDTSPRYHARDTAIIRAQLSKAVVVLGSATPSLESYHNAQSGKYRLFALTHRFGQARLPEVAVVDMREERKANNWGVFSRLLQGKIAAVLSRGEQVILLQNRRGFSAFLKCRDCGFVFECRNCKVTMPYHLDGYSLMCHYCGYTHKAPSVCPSCQGEHIKYRGVGTERIEEELKKEFPLATVTRMDLDTTAYKWAHYRLLEKFRTGQSQILLGTQMIAKGLDFPNVTLTGVVSADIGLNLPDFRAEERTFQLLTQIAGRTGRGAKPGEVVIQSYSPQEYSIECAREHDFIKFYNQEIKVRRQFNYPPFSRLALILLSGTDEKRVIRCSQVWEAHLKNYLQKRGLSSLQLLGPAPAMLVKIKKRFRWQIALKSKTSPPLHKMLVEVSRQLRTLDNKVKVAIDIDPLDML